MTPVWQVMLDKIGDEQPIHGLGPRFGGGKRLAAGRQGGLLGQGHVADAGHVEHDFLHWSMDNRRSDGRRLVGGVALARQEQTAGGEEPREDTASIAFPKRESAAHDRTVLVVERGSYPVAEFLCPRAPAVKL